MRIAFLTHYYPPELGAAPARIAALATGLAARGVEVTVHTGFPHYPSGSVEPPHRNRPWRVERVDGIRVVRSAVYATPNRGTVRRLLDHAVLAGSALAASPLGGPADLVVAESPPLFTAAAGVAFARSKRAPLALNVSDLWPQSAVELGALRRRNVIRLAERLETACYAGSAAITAPTEGIVARLARHPAAAGRQHLVPPAVDVERFAGVPPVVPPAPDAPLRLLYAGTLGMAQRMETVLDAMTLLRADEAHLTIVGDGPDRAALRDRVARQPLPHVEVVGPLPPAAVVGRYADCHVGLVPLRDLPLFRGALPTKLYEVMAAGRPAILAARGEAADLVVRTGAGVVVPPEDPHALAAAVRDLRSSPARATAMGSAGVGVADAHSRGAAIDRWAALAADLTR